MGAIERISDGRRWHLSGLTLLGRQSSAQVTVDATAVSRAHASIQWEGMWRLSDLGSTNGTSIANTSVSPGKSEPLMVGAVFQLGGATGPQFRLVDGRPPRAFVVRPDGRHQELDDGARMGIPCDEEPVVFLSHDGMEWLIHRDDDVKSLGGWLDLELDGRMWRVYAPDDFEITGDLRCWRLEDMRVRFDVSSDEERVDIGFDGPGNRFILPSRSYHYLLVTLARQRIADQKLGLEEEDAGWMERKTLLEMLKLESKTLSVWLSRARESVARKKLRGAQRLIQVRYRGQQIRLGLSRISVRRASGPYEKTPEQSDIDQPPVGRAEGT